MTLNRFMGSILMMVLFSVSPVAEAENLCVEVVATLEEFKEYTELTNDQVRLIAGRCYSVYVENEEQRVEREEREGVINN